MRTVTLELTEQEMALLGICAGYVALRAVTSAAPRPVLKTQDVIVLRDVLRKFDQALK